MVRRKSRVQIPATALRRRFSSAEEGAGAVAVGRGRSDTVRETQKVEYNPFSLSGNAVIYSRCLGQYSWQMSHQMPVARALCQYQRWEHRSHRSQGFPAISLPELRRPYFGAPDCCPLSQAAADYVVGGFSRLRMRPPQDPVFSTELSRRATTPLSSVLHVFRATALALS